MTNRSHELVSVDELRLMLATYAGPPTAIVRQQRRSARLRLVLVATVAAVALVGAGVGIADEFGAFDGIGAAQHPPVAADVLDAETLAAVRRACPRQGDERFYHPFCHLVFDSTRLVGDLPPIGHVYVIADTRGDLCTILESGDASCGPPLSASQPISFGTFNPSSTQGGTFFATGLATDAVAAVSFTVGGKPVNVPVEKNLWIYSEPNSHATVARCVVAHLNDGSAVRPFPEVPCP